KWTKKKYAWYTGYPRQRTETAAARRDRHPDRIIRDAVRRMLPKNSLASKQLDKLKIYATGEHPHQSQQPQPLEV
ncbi:MAG: uL13 family ribosomal protein, partial [Planctomycetales bacterium]|nr:uL13 family ribosomal protein [Planctomycetales bacterium]